MAVETKGEKQFYVDEQTGGTKEVKLARLDLVPVTPLVEVSEHFGKGAMKYADRNWERGYPWSLSYAALLRHLLAWWAGEDLIPQTPEGEPDDPTAGSSHMTAVLWHAMVLSEFIHTHPEKDNRSGRAVVDVNACKSVDPEPELGPEMLTREQIQLGFELGIFQKPRTRRNLAQDDTSFYSRFENRVVDLDVLEARRTPTPAGAKKKKKKKKGKKTAKQSNEQFTKRFTEVN